MFYTEFISASKKNIDWLRVEIGLCLGIYGHITKSKNQACYQLKYAKADSLKLLKKIYYQKNLICLKRKHLKISNALAIIGERIK